MPTNDRSTLRRWTMLPYSAVLLACSALAAPGADAAAAAAAPADVAQSNAAHFDAAWIVARLARPVPMQVPFVEVRESPLLKAPLRLQGIYLRPDTATLVRQVQSPYAETTTLRADQATIARAGKAPRTFSLSRAPELAGLQAGFGAMLSGDGAALDRAWRSKAGGTRARWTLTLLPRDPALSAKIRQVELLGRGSELRCIVTQPVSGPVQRTLVGPAANAARDVVDPAALAALCAVSG